MSIYVFRLGYKLSFSRVKTNKRIIDSIRFQGAPMGEAAFAGLSMSVSVDSLITAAEERALWGKYQTW